MTSPGMIRIGGPARIGTAVEDIRAMLGLSRRDLARALATRTGRSPDTWNSQLHSWERDRSPNPASLGPVLDELGYQLALVPVIESGPQTGPGSTLPAEKPSAGVPGSPEGAETISGRFGCVCDWPGGPGCGEA